MNILELATKVQKSFINRTNGAGSDILYYNFERNISVTARALVSQGVLSDMENVDDGVLSDNIKFNCVELYFVPKKRDKIAYNDEEWFVLDSVPNGDGMYDITCSKNRRHISGIRNR